MKTTLDIPERLLRKAKARAADRGQALEQLVIEALQEKLLKPEGTATSPREWMRGFGKLRTLRTDVRRVQARIDEAFEVVEPEDRRIS